MSLLIKLVKKTQLKDKDNERVVVAKWIVLELEVMTKGKQQ